MSVIVLPKGLRPGQRVKVKDGVVIAILTEAGAQGNNQYEKDHGTAAGGTHPGLGRVPTIKLIKPVAKVKPLVHPGWHAAAAANEDNQFGLAAQAMARGISVDEFKSRLEATMKTDLAGAQIWIRAPHKSLGQILKDGFKPVSESGHTQAGATKHKPGDDGTRMSIAQYANDRRQAEHAMFGIGAPPPEVGSEAHRDHGRRSQVPFAHDGLPAHVHGNSYPDYDKPSDGVLAHEHDNYSSYKAGTVGDGRMIVDPKLWDQQANVEPRPVYGYASSEKDGGLSVKDSSVDQYGEMAIRLKPEVRARTTITYGDSLDNAYHRSKSRDQMTRDKRDADGNYIGQEPIPADRLVAKGLVPHADAIASMTPSLIDNPSAFSVNFAFIGRRQRDDVDTSKPTMTPEMGPATMGGKYSGKEPVHLDTVLRGNPYERLTFHTQEEALAADAKELRTQLESDTARGHHGRSDPLVPSPVMGEHYIETQIHGGVKPEDIAEVVLSDYPTPAVAKQLTKLGIPWSIDKVAAEKFAIEKIKELAGDTFYKTHVKVAGFSPYANRNDSWKGDRGHAAGHIAAHEAIVKAIDESPWITDKAAAHERLDNTYTGWNDPKNLALLKGTEWEKKVA